MPRNLDRCIGHTPEGHVSQLVVNRIVTSAISVAGGHASCVGGQHGSRASPIGGTLGGRASRVGHAPQGLVSCLGRAWEGHSESLHVRGT